MAQIYMINLWTILNVQAAVILQSRDAQNVKMNGIVQENANLKCGSSIKHTALSNAK